MKPGWKKAALDSPVLRMENNKVKHCLPLSLSYFVGVFVLRMEVLNIDRDSGFLRCCTATLTA